MPRIYNQYSEPMDFCNDCFPDEETANKEHGADQFGFFPVNPVVDHIVEGINRRVTGKNGNDTDDGDVQRRESPQPQQSAESRCGHIQQTMLGPG